MPSKLLKGAAVESQFEQTWLQVGKGEAGQVARAAEPEAIPLARVEYRWAAGICYVAASSHL